MHPSRSWRAQGEGEALLRDGLLSTSGPCV